MYDSIFLALLLARIKRGLRVCLYSGKQKSSVALSYRQDQYEPSEILLVNTTPDRPRLVYKVYELLGSTVAILLVESVV